MCASVRTDLPDQMDQQTHEISNERHFPQKLLLQYWVRCTTHQPFSIQRKCEENMQSYESNENFNLKFNFNLNKTV